MIEDDHVFSTFNNGFNNLAEKDFKEYFEIIKQKVKNDNYLKREVWLIFTVNIINSQIMIHLFNSKMVIAKIYNT